MRNFLIAVLLSISFSAFSADRTEIKQITDAEFAQAIDTGLVLVDFWAIWCGPCVRQGQVLSAIAKNSEDYLTIYKMDVDKNHEMPSRFFVSSIPTMIIFRDGKMVKRLTGFHSENQLEAELQKLK